MPERRPLPTVIIGGYLGAGKTTLINHLLRQAQGRRIAVLVNDFGDINIDADLIESRADDGDGDGDGDGSGAAAGNVLSLAGGCVCCSFGSDLVGALITIGQGVPRPDVVLIELSGVALPAAVARSARLAPGIEVQATVVLADAADIERLAGDRYVADTVLAQLQAADLLLLNKTDLVEAARIEPLRQWLSAQAPRSRTLVAAAHALPPELVLDWRDGGWASDDPSTVADHGDPPTPPSPSQRPSQSTAGQALAPARLAPPPPLASTLFTSQVLALPERTDTSALAALLTDPRSGVLRAKGFVTDAAGQGQLLQQVGQRISLTPTTFAGANRLVLIGLRGQLDVPLQYRNP